MKTLHTIYNNFAKRNLASLRLLLVILLTLTVTTNVWGAEYTLITSISNLSNGDKVIIATKNSSGKPSTGVTGGTVQASTSTKKDATTSSTEADWMQFTVTTTTDGWYLSNTSSQYIGKPTENTFYLTTTTNSKGVCSVNNNGVLCCNGRYLQKNSSNYRMYSGINNSYTPFYVWKVSASYTITAQSNNTNYGTVSLSGTTITASPETGYRVSTTTPYTISPSGSATVTQNGNTFTVTPSANTTITINFEALPKYTVTLKDDNSTLTQSTAGATITLPSRDGCDGYEFVGWTKSWSVAQTTWTTTVPTIIPAGSYTPTANESLYPVYTKAEGSGSEPTAYSAGDVGSFIIASNVSDKWYAIPENPTLSSGKISGVEITVSQTAGGVNYVSTANAEGYTWTIADATNGQTISDGTQYIYHSNGGASKTDLAYGTSTSYTWKIEKENNGLTFKGMNGSTTNDRGLLFNGSVFGGYALSNEDKSGYYRIQVLPIGGGSTTYYISVPNCCTQLAEVTNLVFSDITSNSITVGVPNTYAGKDNASGYTFNCYSASTGGSLVATADENGTSHTFTGLTKNTTYYFTVIAKGEGNYCNSAETSPRESSKTLAQYTVTLNPNGGTGDFSGWSNYTMTVDAGTEITLPTLQKIGYDFAGWHDGIATVTSPYTPTKDITITAQWTAIEYTITYNDTKGATNSNPGTYTIEDEITFAALTNLPKGYNFTGWDPTSIAKGTTGNQTVTAQWTEKALTRYRTNCDACIPLDGYAKINGTYHFFPGETITLTVTPPADAVPYTYQWQKLVGSDWTDIAGATTTTYTKDETTIADAGRYKCVVSSEGYCDEIAEYNVKCLQLYVYYDNKSDVFNAPLKKVDGATATIDVELQNAGYTYYFKITDGCGNWYGNTGTMDRDNCTNWPMDVNEYCGLQTTKFGTYVFNVNYSDLTKLTVSVLYPSAYQAADKVIYLDNDVLKWTNSNNAEGKNKIYYRIGRSDHNSKHAMTLVPGTANLYKVTTGEYDNFDVWHIANNGCWSDGNSIYKTNTGDGWAATQATAFETLPVTLAAVTVTPTTLRSVGGDENNNNCDFYNYNITEGMKTWNAEVIEPTNGTITVKYTHHDGTAVNNFTSGDRDLAHTCLLTITATPKVGYSLASLTVNDVPFTSGNVHTLTADAVIKATFTINTHTVTWKPAGGNWDDDASDIVQEYEYGAIIEAPDKPTYDCHEFVEWTPTYNAEMTMPDEDLVFTAKWNKLSYTITFKNYDGTVLQTSTVECGETPSYTGATPTREQDAMYEYEFASWTPTVAEATGDQIYTATYNQTKRQYTVTWFVDGKQIDSESVAAGDLATAPEVNPIPCGAVLAGWTDAENGVYKHGTSTLYEGAQPSIEITDNKTFYAVFADLEGAVPEIPTVIAYWENQKLIKDQGVSATIGAGTMTSNIALSAEYPRTHSNSNISSTYPTLTLSNLNLSSHTNVSLLFWARASQQGTITIKSNLSKDAIATITTTKEEKFYVINNIPSSATSITLTYGKNSGSFYFGSVKLYSAATYSFEKLTAENTNGWSGNDWNGYYLITNDQNSLRALDGNGINEDCHFSVTDNNGIIEYSIASAFQVEFLADEGYCVKGVGDGLYLGAGDNSVTHSANPIYHKSIGYNSLYYSVSSPTSILSWNNSGSKFGFYGSIQTSAPQMYKIMSELSNHRTLCTYEITYEETYGVEHSNPVTYTAANLPLEFTAPTSTREGYTFKGWNPATLSAETRGDQVVEAQWTVNQYTVTWKLNGGQWQGGGIDDIVNNHNYGAEVTKPVDPSRTGYTFTGWSPAEIPTTMPANDLAFTAQWEALPVYAINWRVNGAPADGEPTTSVFEGQYITNLPTTPDVDCNGKEFVGWTTAEIDGETVTIPDPLYTELGNFPAVTSNMTFYAVFAKGEGDNKWIETSIDKIGDTDEVVVTMTNGVTTWALNKILSGQNYPLAPVVEGIDGVELPSTEVTTEIIWNIGGNSTDGYVFYPKGQTAEWLYCTKSGIVKVGRTITNRFTIVNGFLKHTNLEASWEGYLAVSTSADIPDWRMYQSNQGVIASNAQTLKFYKKTTVYTSYMNYSTSCVAGEFDITNTDPIYVTSAVGQKIKATDKLVLTTDMAVGTEISLSAPNITFYKEGIEITQLTTESAEETFELEIAYLPTAENTIEQPTITLDILGHKFTFNNKIFVRSLPETFAIVAKVGNVWYALPSQGLNSTTPPAAYPIEVDDMADPTVVVSVPTNADWSLRQVLNDRFTANGEKLVFVNDANPQKALNAGSTGNYLLADAQYDGYHNTTKLGLYEWIPTTTDLETYQLTNEQRSRTLSVNTATVFGVHATDKAVEQVRFLPIQNRYTPAALQVVEWKENSVVIMYNGDPVQTASVSVNGGAAQETSLSSAQRDIAVYELAVTGLATNPTQRLSITIGTEKVILSIPYIISGSKNDIDVLPGSTVAARQEVAKVSDLVILKGATLTAAGAKGNPYKFRNVTVYGGGKLVVLADNGFGVNSLTLRAGGVTADGNYDYVYPQFVLNGTWTNTSGKINLDYLTTKEQYYTFVAPFAVQTKDIHYPVAIYGNNVKADNKGSFEFEYYDGEARATGATGWKIVEEGADGATLEPGQGYTFLGMPKKVSVNGGSSTRQKFGIHRIPMIVTAEQAMTHENSDQSAPLSVHLADKNNDSGWNLIGNPYMATIGGLTNEDIQVGKLVHTNDANGNWTGGWHWDEQTVLEGQRFLVIPSNDGQSFESTQASKANLPAFKNFFVQISKENANALVIPYNKPTNVLAAPARRTEEVDQDIELAIVLEQDEAHSDQLDFLINNAYTAEFDYRADFTKMMNTTNLNLYGVHTDDNLSFLALDNYSAQQSVAIGYQVPAAGEYMLRMSDKAYVMFEHIEALYVTDHEMSPEQTVDIMEEPYTFHVAKAETNNTRFTVSLKLRDSGGGIVTGFENISTDSEQPFKFFYQDKLYIMRNGVIYDATGKQVHVINE